MITITWNKRRTVCNSLDIVGNIRRCYLHKIQFLEKGSSYGLASAKITYYEAKNALLNTRRYRKSVVLPRLP